MGSEGTGNLSCVTFAGFFQYGHSIRFAPRHGKQCKHVPVNSKQQRTQKNQMGMQMLRPIPL